MRFGELFKEVWALSLTPLRLLIEYPLEHLIIVSVCVGIFVLVLHQHTK